MKKMFFLAATAALALSSCSSDEIVASQTVEDGVVSFSANVLRDTRAYNSDNIDLSGLKDAQSPGFGVYAYEQGSSQWAKYHLTNTVPNFFYNQQVKWSTTPEPDAWTYDPVKYWSNNAGALHSFFAYAPFKNGSNSVFSAEGPGVRYNATENYDLLAAEPVKDKTKQDIHETVNFDFGHALSKVSFQVVPFVDNVHESSSHTPSGTLDSKTKIYVRSIKLVGQVASQGVYNLASKKWTAEAIEEGAYEVADNSVELSNSSTTYVNYGTAITVIPTLNSQKAKIQVIYDVVTTDEAHPQNSSSITNKVTSVDEFELVKGKSYLFKLDLGLTTVKFDAQVTPWSTPATENTVDLPNNHKAEVLKPTTELANKGTVTDTYSFGTGDNEYRYKNGKLEQYTSSAWGAKTLENDKIYAKSGENTLYLAVGTDGTATEFTNVIAYLSSTDKYIVWEGSTFSSTEKPPKAVKSIVPDSEGKLYLEDGTKVTPSDYDVLSCGGKLYIWK